MVHEEYKELISAHALVALERQEEQALNEHLAECAVCRNELDRWRETAASLALTADRVEPSPQVRAKIFKQIEAERRESNSVSAEEEISKKSIGGAHVLPFKQAPKNVWSSFGSLGAIAASLIFVGLLVSLIVLWQQNRAARAELARIAAEMQRTQEQLAREHEALQLITTPGAKMAELAGTRMAPGASAKLAYDRSGHAMLMAKGLPPTPSGKAYQLWYIVGNKPMPGKVFTTDEAGNGTLQDQMPAVAHDGAVFAITLESTGGTQSPTGPIYLSGS
jgi:anti-sigma-K factor RskA